MSTRARGHTLLELTVVLTLLGIMAALAAPALTDRREAPSVDGAARALVALLRDARATAELHATTVTLVVDPATGRAWRTLGRDEHAAPERVRDLPLGSGVTLEGAGARVTFTFTPGGLAFAPPLVVRDGQRVVAVTVDRWSGEPHADAR